MSLSNADKHRPPSAAKECLPHLHSHVVIQRPRKKGGTRAEAQPESHPPANSSIVLRLIHLGSERGRACLREQRGIIRARQQCPLEPHKGHLSRTLPLCHRLPGSFSLSVFVFVCGTRVPSGKSMWQTGGDSCSLPRSEWPPPWLSGWHCLAHSLRYAWAGSGAGQRPPPATYTNTCVYTGCSALCSRGGGAVPAGSGHPLHSVGGEPGLRSPQARSQVEKQELS